MTLFHTLWTIVLLVVAFILIECRTYNNGLIFYNLDNRQFYLPPTISVSRGRGLAKFKYSTRGSIWSTFGKPCDCSGPFCGCCVGIKVLKYNFDQKMCANVSYAPRKDEIQLEVYLNDTSTAKYGIAARNPSPLCIPIMMGIPMSMCIQMSNIGVQGDNLNMCMDFLVRLASTEIFEMHFQCMQVGLQGASWVGADGQPVIPASGTKSKDRISNESEEYYDENGVEEESEEMQEISDMEMQEQDLNKAEEEMDYNDITEKIMHLVKAQEEEKLALRESLELANENGVEVVSPVNNNNNKHMMTSEAEEIVTNIKESINAGKESGEDNKIIKPPVETYVNKMQEIPVLSAAQESVNKHLLSSMEASTLEDNNAIEEATETEMTESNEDAHNDSNKLQNSILQTESESLKQNINDLHEMGVNVVELEAVKDRTNFDNLTTDSVKDELHFEESFGSSKEQEMTIGNSREQLQESNQEKFDLISEENQDKENINTDDAIELDPITTDNVSLNQDSAEIELYETSNNNDDVVAVKNSELNKFDHKHNDSLEVLKNWMESSTEPQIPASTSETGNGDSIANALTTASTKANTIMTTTTETKMPTVLDENSAAAITLIVNTNDHDRSDNDDNEEEVDDNSDDNEAVNGDDSQETDSDYEDDEESEESEETEDETTEKEIETNNAITIVLVPTADNLNNNKNSSITESLTAEQLANTSNSNESNSNEETNENTKDEFEAEEVYANVEDEDESNKKHKDIIEKEYEEETTTTTELVVIEAETKSDNNTCCKSALAVGNKIEQLPNNTNNILISQAATASSNNMKIVSNTNSDMLNAKSTANRISQITNAPTVFATIPTSTATTDTSNKNYIPLPLARKLFALHRQQQQQHHTYQQYNRHSRQRQRQRQH